MSAPDWTPADERFRAFLTALPANAAYLDLAAHATDTELRMIGRSRNAQP